MKMKRKIQKVFIDHGFGFRVKLLNVPMIKVRDVWTPDINYNHLARTVLEALCWKPASLTGNEIKFIRQYFEMTLSEFAGRFYVTHAGVIKWEKSKNRPTGMTWTTEKDIRLFALSRLESEPRKIAKLYGALERSPLKVSHPMEVDAKKIAA